MSQLLCNFQLITCLFGTHYSLQCGNIKVFDCTTSHNLKAYKLLILVIPVDASSFHDPFPAAVCNLSPWDVAVDTDTVQEAYTEPPMDYCWIMAAVVEYYKGTMAQEVDGTAAVARIVATRYRNKSLQKGRPFYCSGLQCDKMLNYHVFYIRNTLTVIFTQ